MPDPDRLAQLRAVIERESPNLRALRLVELVERLARQPLSKEDTSATWVPAEWEDIVEWWDKFVTEAREITGLKYR